MRLLIFLFTLVASVGVDASGLPDAPIGFEWIVSSNGVGTFLKPAGWHVKEEVRDGTNALFITKQPIEDGQYYSTGMAVNQFNNFSNRSKYSASQYSQAYIAEIIQTNNVIKSFKIPSSSGEMYGVRIVGNNNGVETIVHYLAFGNDIEDKVYLLWYESPKTEWDENYAAGSTMLNMFGFGE